MQRDTLKHLTQAAVMLAVAVAVQWFRMPQLVTGTAINAILLISGALITPVWGMAIGVITPLVAVAVGIMPPVLLLVSLFIALGNAVYIFIHVRLYRKEDRRMQVLAVGAASLVKFSILALAANVILTLPPAVTAMLTFPQLVTALLGATLATLLIPSLTRSLKR